MKTLITVSNNITIDISTIPPNIRQTILHELTLDNPAYLQAEKMDRYSGHLEEHIHLYESRGDTLVIPRGFIYRLIGLLKNAGQEYEITDERLLLSPVHFNSQIRARPYQVPAIEKLVKWRNGGLVGGCGSGKTEILLATMAALKQPALWITHSYELLEQVVERALKCFDGMTREEIGVIADGKVSIGDRLTVSLVQTLSKVDLEVIKGKFGAVFVDEGHRLAAQSFMVPIGQFPARYRIWCSATPIREDGLTQMVLVAGGPILYMIQDKDLPTVTPQLRIIETSYTGYVDAEDYAGMLTDMVSNMDRNITIVDTITNEAPSHFSLVLSDRITHLDILKAMLVDKLPSLNIEILNGQLPKKQRINIMERARAKGVDILLATQLAREGLDLPHLDRLFLVSPKKAGGATEQEIGRIRRPCGNKPDAVIFDFWDTQNPIFKSQFWKRRAVYEKLGIEVDFKKGMQRIPQ